VPVPRPICNLQCLVGCPEAPRNGVTVPNSVYNLQSEMPMAVGCKLSAISRQLSSILSRVNNHLLSPELSGRSRHHGASGDH